jgi:uncharacterized alkaline shock family protein YloU
MAKAKESTQCAELRLEGVDLAPGVLETIVVLATESVDGVASVYGPGLAGLMAKQGAKGVELCVDDDGKLIVTVHVFVDYGQPLRHIAETIQTAVYEALLSQTAAEAHTVDVFIDGIAFPE